MSYVIKLFTVWIFLKVNTFFADSFMFWYVPISLSTLSTHSFNLFTSLNRVEIGQDLGRLEICRIALIGNFLWVDTDYWYPRYLTRTHAAANKTKLRMECWKKRVFWWWAARAPDPPAAGRRSSGAPAGWATAAPAACPGSGWSSAASSARQGCRSRGHAESWWSSSGDSPPSWAPAGRGVLQKYFMVTKIF